MNKFVDKSGSICPPSRRTLRPRPVGLGFLHRTCRDEITFGFALCSACKACSEAALNSSEPQNRIRKGSKGFLVEKVRGRSALL